VVEVMLGDGELMLLILPTLVMDKDGGQVLFCASATWVGDDARDESVSVRVRAEDTETDAQSWTDDLSLWSTPSRKEVGRAMGKAETKSSGTCGGERGRSRS